MTRMLKEMQSKLDSFAKTLPDSDKAKDAKDLVEQFQILFRQDTTGNHLQIDPVLALK